MSFCITESVEWLTIDMCLCDELKVVATPAIAPSCSDFTRPKLARGSFQFYGTRARNKSMTRLLEKMKYIIDSGTRDIDGSLHGVVNFQYWAAKSALNMVYKRNSLPEDLESYTMSFAT
jgi:hypothetical protein